MKTLTEEFGWNAGKVWKILSTNGPLREDVLLKTTKLSEDELWTAVGWLARENKISKENNLYKLGQTNLTEKIGTDAGKVWATVSQQGDVDISTIARNARLTEVDAYCALGWLAREDKIHCKKIRIKGSKIKVSLK
ncbi:MAG: winged helix-turn-helix domain-containing protein [Candidatus Thermoplasmatota archaeon]|nr:winged helix-turn-helix domain-containing protein [Candidatus Thermoplasmatota archaeon]